MVIVPCADVVHGRQMHVQIRFHLSLLVAGLLSYGLLQPESRLLIALQRRTRMRSSSNSCFGTPEGGILWCRWSPDLLPARPAGATTTALGIDHKFEFPLKELCWTHSYPRHLVSHSRSLNQTLGRGQGRLKTCWRPFTSSPPGGRLRLIHRLRPNLPLVFDERPSA